MNGWLLIPIIIAAAIVGFAIGNFEKTARRFAGPPLRRQFGSNPDPTFAKPAPPPNPPALDTTVTHRWPIISGDAEFDGVLTRSPYAVELEGPLFGKPKMRYSIKVMGGWISPNDWSYVAEQLNRARRHLTNAP